MRNHFQWRAGLLLSGVLGLAACDSNDDKDPPLSAGDTWAVTSNNRLLSFNRAERSVRTAVDISALQGGEKIVGIDVRPSAAATQELYAVGDSGRIYLIDTGSGAATLKSQLSADAADTTDGNAPFTALSGTAYGVDFNPVVDRLRIVSNNGQNLRVNVDTGKTFTDGGLSVGGAALAGVGATAYSNGFAAACRTTHYFIDTGSTPARLLSAINSNVGTLTVVGALGVNADAVSGFDVLTGADGSNTLLAALSVGGSVRLYSIDAASGTATDGGTITGLAGGETVRGIAVAALATAPTQAPGELLALSEDNQLLSFNSAAPQKLCTSSAVTVPAGETLQGFDLRPETGELIALTTSATASKLYGLDAASGALTAKSTLSTAASGATFGLDFNPTVDRLRVVSDSGQNLRINVDSGAVTVDGGLNGAATGATAAAYTNGIGGLAAPAPGAFGTALYVIDAVTDSLYLQTPPNNGTLVGVGALGIDIDAPVAFDINARSGQALAALTPKDATASELYSINLASGVATRINAIGGGKKIKGLSYRVNTKAALIGLTGDNRLTVIPVAAPATAAAPVAITGLAAGETLLGFDRRPATGDLVALSDLGKLYKLSFDGTTAAAAPLSTLSTTLNGTAFGVDFNPLPDRLRVVSDNEQNLRINVATGATTVDASLSGAAGVFAAAYTQSYDGATSTKLYTIDATTNQLLTTADPNLGVMTPVGALGIDVTAEGDFDISGGQDGLVFAALQRDGDAGSRLYRLDLASGVTTEVGAGIGDGSYVVRGLSLRLQ
ncbi:MAG: DUF4394 domain-containing protein [Solimonas sp.]